MKGDRSHAIIRHAEEILINMTHRGAVGAEPDTGDGAGILTAVPWELLERVAEQELDIVLPGRGSYAVGLVFLPDDPAHRDAIAGQARTFVPALVIPCSAGDRYPGTTA